MELRMFFTRYTIGDREYVAFGNYEQFQSVHRVAEGEMREVGQIWPSISKFGDIEDIDVKAEGQATREELIEWFGPIVPLDGIEGGEFRDRFEEHERRESARRRFSEPLHFRLVPDEVVRIPSLSDDEVVREIQRASERVGVLEEDKLRAYEQRLGLYMIRYGESPTPRQRLDGMLMTLDLIEDSPEGRAGGVTVEYPVRVVDSGDVIWWDGEKPGTWAALSKAATTGWSRPSRISTAASASSKTAAECTPTRPSRLSAPSRTPTTSWTPCISSPELWVSCSEVSLPVGSRRRS